MKVPDLPADIIAEIHTIEGLAESCFPSLEVDRTIARRRLSLKRKREFKPSKAWRKVTFKLQQEQYEELEVLQKLKAAPSIAGVVKLCLALGIGEWYKMRNDVAAQSTPPEEPHPEDQELPELGYRELSAPWTSPQSPTLGAEI